MIKTSRFVELLNIETLQDVDGTIIRYVDKQDVERETRLNESLSSLRRKYLELEEGKRDTIYATFGSFGNMDIKIEKDKVSLFDGTDITYLDKIKFKEYLYEHK